MAKSGTLTIRVLGDTKDVEQSMKRTADTVQTTGEKFQSAGKKMTVFATVPIVGAMGLATKAASDLNETLSKSNTVFGESGKAVEDWADGASDSFGQSKREALDAASTFGNLFVQLGVGSGEASKMSMAMTELASDFASFHNADITEVIDAQSAAFRGEYDALQRFVPTINAAAVEQEAMAQSGKKVNTELTAQEKALAVQTLMLEGAGDAMGDFDRTSDSAANQSRKATAAMEDASAEIGEALLPLVAAAAGGVADLAKGFSDLPDPIQDGVLALAGLLAVAGPVMTVGGKVMTVWSKAGPIFDKAAVGAFSLSGNIRKVATGGAALAVAGIAVERTINAWSNEMAEANEEASALARRLTGDFDPSKASIHETHDEIIRLNGAIAELDAHHDEAINPFLRARYAETSDELGAARDALLATEAAASDLQAELGVTADQAWKMATNSDVMAAATDNATGELDAAAAAAAQAAEDEKDLADSVRDVTDAYRAQIDPLFAAQDAMVAHRDAQEAVTEAQAQVWATTIDLNGAIREHGEDSVEAMIAAKDLADAERRLETANRDVTRSALDVSTATFELKQSMENGEISIEGAKNMLAEWVAQGLLTEEQARAASGELGLVAGAAREADGLSVMIPVGIDASDFDAKLSSILGQISGLSTRDATTLILRDAAVAGRRHSGGPVTANHPYIVGRPGAEELFVPGADGRIISGSQTDRILGRTGGSAAQRGAPQAQQTRIHPHDLDRLADRLVAGMARAMSNQRIVVGEHVLGGVVRGEGAIYHRRNGL